MQITTSRRLNLQDQQKTIERLFREGESRDQKRQQLQQKWESIGHMLQQSSGSGNKDFNNKIVYDKLKRDFA